MEGIRLPDALRKRPKRIRDVRIPHILTEHSGSDMTPVKVYLTLESWSRSDIFCDGLITFIKLHVV